MSFDYDTELKSTAESSDRFIPISSQTETSSLHRRRTFLSHECLPASSIGIHSSGLHDTSSQYNMKYYVNIGEEFFVNVVVPGGTTMFQRIFERTTRKLTALASTTMRIIVGCSAREKH